MNKKIFSFILAIFLVLILSEFVSALCKGSDGYWRDCNDNNYNYNYNRNSDYNNRCYRDGRYYDNCDDKDEKDDELYYRTGYYKSFYDNYQEFENKSWGYYDRGYASGDRAGLYEGLYNGLRQGLDEGYDYGYGAGYPTGKYHGFKEGFEYAYDYGYNDGYYNENKYVSYEDYSYDYSEDDTSLFGIGSAGCGFLCGLGFFSDHSKDINVDYTNYQEAPAYGQAPTIALGTPSSIYLTNPGGTPSRRNPSYWGNSGPYNTFMNGPYNSYYTPRYDYVNDYYNWEW